MKIKTTGKKQDENKNTWKKQGRTRGKNKAQQKTTYTCILQSMVSTGTKFLQCRVRGGWAAGGPGLRGPGVTPYFSGDPFFFLFFCCVFFPGRRFVAGFYRRLLAYVTPCIFISIISHISIQYVSIQYVSHQCVSIQKVCISRNGNVSHHAYQ